MTPNGWQGGALALAATASAALCVVPVIGTSTSVSTSDGAVVVTEESTTLLAEQGAGILVVLAVPVLLTAVPLLLGRWAGWLCTGALAALVLVTGFSIGLWYVPALLLAVGALAARDAERAPAVLPVEGRWPGY